MQEHTAGGGSRLNEDMLIGVSENTLCVRLDTDQTEGALLEPHVKVW
jgi:hypothetical protein